VALGVVVYPTEMMLMGDVVAKIRAVLEFVELGVTGMRSFAKSVVLELVLALVCSLDSGVTSNRGCMCSRKGHEPGCWNVGNCHPQWRSLALLLHGVSGMHQWDVLPMRKIHMP